jgi:hypothetical protein
MLLDGSLDWDESLVILRLRPLGLIAYDCKKVFWTWLIPFRLTRLFNWLPELDSIVLRLSLVEFLVWAINCLTPASPNDLPGGDTRVVK